MATGDNVCVPFFEPDDRPSFRATALVRGKRFVAISASPAGGMLGTENIRGAEAGAGAHAIGVNNYDVQNQEEGGLICDGIVPMVCGAALTAGTAVQSDAQGRAIPLAAGAKLGVCVADQAVVDADVAVRLNLG